MKIGLIAGTGRKYEERMMAKDLYSKSPLFRYSLAYCLKNYSISYIISAKHGLIELDHILDPYDEPLVYVQYKSYKEWLRNISEQIRDAVHPVNTLHFHAGNRFRRLIEYLPEYTCYEPTKGMDIGKQLKYLKEVSKGDESL